MKRLKLLMSILMLLFATIAFTSCSNEDDENLEEIGGSEDDENGIDASLIGIWAYSESYSSYTYHDQWTFKQNGTYSRRVYYTEKNGQIFDDITDAGDWSVDGNTLTYGFFDGTARYSFKYRVSGNNLFIRFDSDSSDRTYKKQ